MILRLIKHSDRKSESDSPPVTTKKATVEKKVKETSERVERRAKRGAKNYEDMKSASMPSQLINPPIHFCHDTTSPPSPSIIPRRIEFDPSYQALLHRGYKSHHIYYWNT
ncbi:hypothetical protein ACOME3_004717 [Neoechinorhynchus agilis]